MGGVILASLSLIFSFLVILCTGYYRNIYYKVLNIERPQTERPDYWAVTSWENTVEKLHLNSDIVFYGNSITMGSAFEDVFASDSLLIVNLGYVGDDIKGLTMRHKMVKACNPKKLFLMAGINGLKYQTLDEFRSLYSNLLDTLVANNPKTKIFIQSILPINMGFDNENIKKYCPTNEKIIRANNIIRDIANCKRLDYIDLHSLYYENGEMPERLTRDGIHLKPEAYQIWADAIRPYIK